MGHLNYFLGGREGRISILLVRHLEDLERVSITTSATS